VHSSTYGQNDLAMAAVLATMHVLESEKLVESAAAVGGRLLEGMKQLVSDFEMVANARGKGLLLALEFGPPKSLKLKVPWAMLHTADKGLFPQAVLIPLLREHRVLALVAGHHQDVIKFTPALTLTMEDAEAILTGLRATIAECHRFPGPVWKITKQLSSHALSLRKTPA
jgi:ornithine--oxo-acid transaminase